MHPKTTFTVCLVQFLDSPKEPFSAILKGLMTNRSIRVLSLSALLLALANVAVPAALAACANPMIDADCASDTDVHLLQPLGNRDTINTSAVPLETFFEYFNDAWPWLLGIASGIAVLQAVWGGVLIMTSIDRDGGKEKIQWAVGGMVMIALAGFILRFLNSIFYA